jgi:D-alanyl-lipoteichoic acid acyltransferase DltB (MBOAT superfamily)
LIVTSLVFYSWSNPWNLPIIVVSILVNYGLGYLISHKINNLSTKKLLLTIGLILNIAFLAYYKYFNFFVENFNNWLGADLSLTKIILPVGISFFTFQQIAYLVDVYQGKTQESSLLKYCLFVSFFPLVSAGPILRHKELAPQLTESSIYKFDSQNFAVGLTLFMGGLFKKVVFADRIAEFSNLAFGAAAEGVTLTFSESWVGALAYTLQLYFDFSGYSDMAIAIAYMFGIKFPLNFNSPYKSISIIDFWRRWHITLSYFLRDYLYIPLGGNRKGKIRQYLNLMITMLLGGLWHGAGWTFVLWGGLHGFYLVINHCYSSVRKSLGHNLKQDPWLLKGIGWFVTFIAVVVSWVFFRAKDVDTALSILSSMVGMNGIQLPAFFEPYLAFMRDWGVGFLGFTVDVGISQKYAVFGTAILLLIAWFTPNTEQWLGKYNPTLTQPVGSNEPSWLNRLWQSLSWQPNKIWTVVVAGITAVSLLCFTRVSEFLYFQF